MNEEKKFAGYWSVFCMNFCSSFNPVYFCTLTAICFFRETPVLSRQSYNVLMVAAMYALPWLFSSALTKYFLGKFSSRGVIVYCKLAEIAVALLAVIFSLFTVKTGYIPLFAVAVLMGLSYSICRPALKTYAAEMVKLPMMARFAAAVECGTFIAIASGTFTAAALVFQEIPLFYGIVVTLPVAFCGLISSFSLSPVYAPETSAFYQEPFPLSPPAGLKKLQRYWELVFTGIG